MHILCVERDTYTLSIYVSIFLYFLHSISSSLSLFETSPTFYLRRGARKLHEEIRKSAEGSDHRHCVAFHIAVGFRPPFETGPGGCGVAPRGCGNSGAMTPSTWNTLKRQKQIVKHEMFRQNGSKINILYCLYIIIYITTQVLLAFPGPNLETGWRKGKSFRSCVAYLLENIYRC